MIVEIDKKSGFCFGVVHAIEAAEYELEKTESLYCLGDIVHNSLEVERLNGIGLRVIDNEKFQVLRDSKVLIRAHGEPPETYALARKNNIQLTDASCPIVLNLQNKIQKGFEEMQKLDGQIVIFGKEGHAEVIGLKGQAKGRAIVISGIADLDKINFQKPLRLYAQTTQSPEKLQEIKTAIQKRYLETGNTEDFWFKAFDTICRQVSNRAPELMEFAKKFDVVLFVSDQKSSNGQYLLSVCKESNAQTHFVSKTENIDSEWFKNANSVGICGATSTPQWVMEEIRDAVLALS